MATIETWFWNPGIIIPTGTNNDLQNANLGGTSIDPASYVEGEWNDNDNSGGGFDLDSDDGSSNTPDFITVDGGTPLQMDEGGGFGNSVIQMEDGTNYTVGIQVFMLTDGTVLFRLTDGDLARLTADGYGRHDVEQITLGPSMNENQFRDYGNYDDAFPCFNLGSRILTTEGQVEVQNLQVGDEVVTRDGSHSKIIWLGRRAFARPALERAPKLFPVRIVAGALGMGLPTHDLLVSRQHRMVVSSKVAERMFGQEDVFVSAIKLTKMPGIFIDESVDEVEYFHILLEDHKVIFAEGAPTESLLAGPQAMKSLPRDARLEILTVFPEFQNARLKPPTACPVPARSGQKTLVARHVKNRKPLLELFHA